MKPMTATIMTFWTATVYELDPPATYGGLMTIRVLGIGWGLIAIAGILEILAKSQGEKS